MEHSCCVACEETHRMVTEIHEGLSKVAELMSAMQDNPMARMMLKNMGVNVEALKNANSH